MTGWDDVAFLHLLFAPFLLPPDVVSLVSSSRETAKTFDNADSWRAVTKACFGAVGGARGHLSRRQRKKKGTWRAGDGPKARLSVLWLQRTRENVARLQAAHLTQQREHERRWVLQQAAMVMRNCAYTSRQGRGGSCLHTKLRLWTSATLVAAKPSLRSKERPPSHPGVRCDRCRVGPIKGSCFRCAAGCEGVSTVGSGRGRRCFRAERRKGDNTVHTATGKAGDASAGGYTLCEACFLARRTFHPPHPFARLRPGLVEPRLSGPVLYEAVCGECYLGSLILVRPLKTLEVADYHADPCGSSKGRKLRSDELWAVPVRVEAAGPLPLSQVKGRIAAGNRDDNRGLAFVSDNWPAVN